MIAISIHSFIQKKDSRDKVNKSDYIALDGYMAGEAQYMAYHEIKYL